MFDQLSKSHPTEVCSNTTFFIYNNQVFCDLQSIPLNDPNTSPSSEIYEFDHIYPSSTHPSPASFPNTLIFYTSLGSPAFYTWYPTLRQYCQNHDVTCIYRHMHPPEHQSLSFIQGFGIGLTIKNMEYKTIDDKIEKSADAASAESKDLEMNEEELKDVEGFNINKLIQRYPEDKDNLLKFKDALITENQQEDKIEIWQLKDIGLKATQRILTSKDPLNTLEDLAQNLPSRMHSLASIPVPSSLTESIQELRDSIPSSQDMLWINGVDVSIQSPHFNVFDLFSLIQTQVDAFAQLDAVTLPTTTKEQLQSIAQSWATRATKNQLYRLSSTIYEETALLTLNNVERDSRYNTLSDNLQLFLLPMYGFPQVRANYMNRLLLIDVEDQEALQQLLV